MKYSVKFSDAIHIMSYLEIYKGTDLSSDTIARSVEANAVSVRKIMSELKKAGLIFSKNGKAEPRLAKTPAEISLYDIYKSVEPEAAIFHVDEKTAPACIVGGNIQSVLNKKYTEFQHTVEAEMQQTTLADIIREISLAEKNRNPHHAENLARVTPYL
jgi:Rrf2 family protein